MSSIIVECRNKEAEAPLANGDWTTILGHDIMLSSGDSIVVKDSFIDTQQTSSQKLLIREDQTLRFEYGFYVYNLPGFQEEYRNYQNSGDAPPGDVKEYVLCRETQALTANDHVINTYTVTTNDKSITSTPGEITLRYTDFEGNAREKVARIPAVKGEDGGITIPEWENIIYTDTRTLVYEPPLSTLNLVTKNIEQSEHIGYKPFVPYTQQKTIVIKAGNYDPDTLCEEINIAMTQTSVNKQFFQQDINNILQTGQQIQREFSQVGPPVTLTHRFGLCKAEAGNINPMRVKSMEEYPNLTGADLLFGSSQFEIGFDPAGYFVIKYLHMPLYHQNGITTGLFALLAETSEDLYNVNKTGGIYLTNLESFSVATGKSTDFWDVSLGFDLSTLLTTWRYQQFTTTGPGAENILIITSMGLQDGTNVTGQLRVLDSGVDKNDPRTQNKPAVGTPIFATADATKTIGIGSNLNTSLDAVNNFGYYLIEVKSNFKNKFFTEDNNYNHIAQIVNRYYELNSYTSAESGQVVYVHQGEPALLQSFHCRVLTSDKQLAPNIGNDNTIHLEIVKSSQPQLPPPEPKKKK